MPSLWPTCTCSKSTAQVPAPAVPHVPGHSVRSGAFRSESSTFMKRKFHMPWVRPAKGPIIHSGLSTVGFLVHVGPSADQPVRRALLPHSSRSETDSALSTWAASLRVVSPLNGHHTARGSYTNPDFCISESSHLSSAQQGPTIIFSHRNLNFQHYWILKNLNP